MAIIPIWHLNPILYFFLCFCAVLCPFIDEDPLSGFPKSNKNEQKAGSTDVCTGCASCQWAR
ncbi:hypothetical protein B0F90DRAFT_1729480 [Multifurca ochricompacta]|uniref:Uncharacterized protein n=1 Tax=Multifurca ochricompacta TaxID=376703 RepID=A0AAD4QK39_9AGAM|nr:hypothetical protein B0F90DRAFT_1729480 [Multifurca ochricompacta]